MFTLLMEEGAASGQEQVLRRLLDEFPVSAPLEDVTHCPSSHFL